MHYNQILKNDLTIYFRYKKKNLYCRLFSIKNNINKNEWQYFLRVNILFEFLDKPLMESLVLSNKLNEKCIPKTVSGKEYFFNKGFKLKDLFTMIENNSILSKKINKLNESYETFLKIDTVYRVSGHDQVVVKTNPRYTQSLRRVFNRFGANIHCVEMDDTVEKFDIIFEVKPNDPNSSSNK